MLGCFMYNSGTELILYLYFSSLFICVHWLNHRVQKKTNENNFYINHNCVFNIGCIIISCYLYQHFDNNFSLQNIWSLLIFLWWKNRHIFQIITKNMVLFFIIITIWVCFFVTRKKVFVIVLTVEDSYVMVNELTKDIVLLVGITTLYIRSTCWF